MPAQDVEASIGDDAVHPRAEGGVAAEPRQPPPGADEGVLHGLLGVRGVAQHLVRQRQHRRAVAVHQDGERVVVAFAGPRDQQGVLQAVESVAGVAWLLAPADPVRRADARPLAGAVRNPSRVRIRRSLPTRFVPWNA